MRIELTPENHREARKRAEFFAGRVIANNFQPVAMQSHDRETMLRRHILGELSECLVAKAFGYAWLLNVNGFHDPDVGPFWVRSTEWEHGSLIYRERDEGASAPWVLVYVPNISAAFGVVCGWCYGREAKREAYLQQPNGRPPAWFVPRAALRRLDDPELRQFVKCQSAPWLF